MRSHILAPCHSNTKSDILPAMSRLVPGDSKTQILGWPGLTAREWFAGQALASIELKGVWLTPEEITRFAKLAVHIGDEVMAVLENSGL